MFKPDKCHILREIRARYSLQSSNMFTAAAQQNFIQTESTNEKYTYQLFLTSLTN